MNRALFWLLLASCAPDADPVDPTPPDPLSDADGDGLTYQEEVNGWTISVNSTGYHQDSRTTQVTSDPDAADSDGDGLSDLEERLYKSDPRLVDTDGDGLPDLDEVRRWGTSPSRCDTDADSQGADPDFPAPPSRALFDGGELQLEERGGRLVPGLRATSPIHADTDGDGFTDYEELAVTRRDPLLAELPRMEINPSPYSGLDLSLEVIYESGSGISTNHGTSFSWESSSDWERTSTKTMAASQELSMRLEAKGNVSVGLSLGLGGDLDERLTSRTRVSAGYAYQLDRSQQVSSGAERQAYQQRSNREASEVVGARVQMLVDVQNTGRRTYLVEGLGMAVYHWSGTALLPVAYLEPTVPAFTLGPGESFSGLILADRGANPAMVLEMMKNPHTIVLGTAGFDLVDQAGSDFAFVDETVFERTSRLSVELPGEVADLDVASHVQRSDAGAVEGVAVSQALTLADIDYEVMSIPNPVNGGSEDVFVVAGLVPEFHEGPAPTFEGLDEPGYPRTGGPGDRYLRSGWFTLLDRREAPDEEPGVALLGDTRLYPGDQAVLVFATDADQDGIIDREELLSGSSDASLDSDWRRVDRQDFLSDYWELREGWDVHVEGREPYHVFSDPGSLDADGDGLYDNAELLHGTDPWLFDTDGDGYSDRGEIVSVGLGLDPLVPNPGGELTVSCELHPTVRGSYLIEVRTTMGRPGANYIHNEQWDATHRRIQSGPGYVVVHADDSLVQLEALIPAAIEWPEIRPVALGTAAGGAASVSTTCPPPR